MEEEKKLDSFTTGNLKKVATTSAYTDEGRRRKSAAMGVLAKRTNKLRGADKKQDEDMEKAALDYKKMGGDDSIIYDKRLDWAANDDRDVYDKTIKGSKPEDIAGIIPDSLVNEDNEIDSDARKEVLGTLLKGIKEGDVTPSHLSQVASKNPELRKAFTEHILKENILKKAGASAATIKQLKTYLKTDASRALWGSELGEEGEGIKVETPLSAGGRKISDEELEKAKESLKK